MIDIDKIEAAASADRELDTVTVLRPAVVREMVSMIRERGAVLRQALSVLENVAVWETEGDDEQPATDAVAAIKGVLEP